MARGRPRAVKEEAVEAVKEEVAPLTIPDEKVNTVAEAAAKIIEKKKHPGPWVYVKPREGLSIEQELVELQKEKRLIGYNPKNGKCLLK